MASSDVRHDPFAALRFPDFRLLTGGRFIALFGEMMLVTAVGWEIYDRTGNALLLGIIGLVQVIPVFLFGLPAGYIVDKYNRRRIAVWSQIAQFVLVAVLAYLSAARADVVWTFVVLTLIGAARAFHNPADGAIIPLVVPSDAYQNAATWRSMTWQTASILGPPLGGYLIALTGGAASVYGLFVLLNIPLVFVLLRLNMRPQTYVPPEETPLDSLKGGLRFLRDNRLILSSITLDMFAVLFGGATYLLPVFAKDILHVDSTGLGLLRAAPSIGALVMAVLIARRPPFTQAGRALLWSVAGFGVATIVFGVSTNFWLSMAMMFTLGSLDNISVVIRHTLVLVFTPDDMRGRVGAVNSMFIGASNELGGFESGFTAALFGPVGAVVIGGLGTMLVVGAIAYFSPELRRLKRLTHLDGIPETDLNPTPDPVSPQVASP